LREDTFEPTSIDAFDAGLPAGDRLTPRHLLAGGRERLKRTLPAEKRRELIKDNKLAPAWMHPIFRELAESARILTDSSPSP
jgi:hypothetical protein